MKQNVLNVAGTTIGTIRTSLARLTNKVSSQVKNLLEALDCPIETAADAHYVKCTLACSYPPSARPSWLWLLPTVSSPNEERRYDMTRKGTYDCTDLYIEKKIRYEEGGFFDGNFYTLHIGGDTISCLIMEQLKDMHKLLGQVIEAETKRRKALEKISESFPVPVFFGLDEER